MFGMTKRNVDFFYVKLKQKKVGCKPNARNQPFCVCYPANRYSLFHFNVLHNLSFLLRRYLRDNYGKYAVGNAC